MSLTALVLLTASIGAVADDVPAVTGTVVDEKDQPVAQADIYLFEGPLVGRLALFGAELKTRQPPPLFATTRSDTAGEFEIALPSGLPRLWYESHHNWLALAIYKPGLAVKTRLIERYWPARAAPIRLVLVPPRTNRVRILSPSEQPLAHARVWADQVDGVSLPNELTQRLAAETNEAGEAELPDVAGEMLRTVRVDSAQFGAQWAILARSSDGETSPLILSPVGAIRGRLLDAGGAAIASTRVRLTTWIEPRDDLAGGGMAELTTDADGRFDLPAIAAGTLQAAVKLPPDSPLVSTYQGTQQLEADTANDATIRFKRGVHVHGTVVDQADRPVAGAVISLGSSLDSPLAECDEAGRYSGYLLPGLVHLSLVHLPLDYYVPAGIVPNETVPDDAREMTFQPLRVAVGATLSGRVVDPQGSPVAGAEVVGRFPRTDVGERMQLARSDRDGNFIMPNLPTSGSIRITASSATLSSKSAIVAGIRDPDLTTVPLEPFDALSVSGRAIDTLGRPIAGAAVRIVSRRSDRVGGPIDEGFLLFDGSQQIYTDIDGRFATPKQLRADRSYRVDIDAPGMMPVRTEAVDSAQWHTLDFGDIVLPPTPRLRAVVGQVVDQAGRPVADAVVRQAGDGPRPTRAISDADGRFRIGGVYEGPAWLLVSHDGSRLQADRINAGSREVRVVLRDLARTPRVPDAPSVSRHEEEAVIRALLDEHRGRFERGPGASRSWVAAVEYILSGNLADSRAAAAPDYVRAYGYKAAHRIWSPEQIGELAQAIDDTKARATLYLSVCDALSGDPAGQRDALAEALLAARAVDAPHLRIRLLGEIGERFFDLGDHEVGAAIVREGREQLAAVPDDDAPASHYWRASFAAALVYLDLPAAYALVDKLGRPRRDWFLADIARSLAADDPAEAERAIEKMEFPNLRSHYGAGTVHRMASVDPERAARIARSFSLPGRAYALGLVAEAQASAHPELAANLVEEAYRVLERSLADGTADTEESTCGTAAALLVIVERTNPALLDHYMARALAMRPPRPARGDPGARYEGEIAQMALAVLPYDPQTARALMEPLASRIRSLSALIERFAAYGRVWTAFALIDPAWAHDLVKRLRDAPPDAANSPQADAAEYIIDALIRRDAVRWPSVYLRYLHARHPDTPMRER